MPGDFRGYLSEEILCEKKNLQRKLEGEVWLNYNLKDFMD